MSTPLNAFIQRFQNLPPFNVKALQADGTVVPWYTCNPGELVLDLVIREDNIPQQISELSTHIMNWGRIASLAQRVWEIEQRRFRTWKAQRYIELAQQPEGWTPTEKDAKGKDKSWSKPSDKAIEFTYRTEDAYIPFNQAVEEAAEAYNCAQAFLDAFKAKRDMLRLAIGPAQAKMTT